MAKRFIVLKGGTIVHRTWGQDHFNSRERSKVTRNKRTDRAWNVPAVSKTIALSISK